MQKFLVVKANGDTEVLTDPQLKDFQNAVGGYITIAYPPVSDCDSFALYAHDEALLMPDPQLNSFASNIAGQPIFGDVVIISIETDAEGNTLSPWTEKSLEDLERVARAARKTNQR